MINTAAALVIALLGIAPRAQSQGSAVAIQSVSEMQLPPRVPFGVGELLDYQIRVGPLGGSATLQIISLDTVRGRPAWHTQFTTRGGIPGFRVNDKYDSWIDINTISTLRYREDVHEANYERKRNYEFYPAQRRFIEGVDTVTTVERPVDQASIFYLIRTLDLRVGLDTNLNNYFLVDRNPIRIQVLGRERIRVPAGEFDAIVIHPVIKAKGIFSEGGDAKIWVSDDERRLVLQIKAKVPGFPFGGLNLYLRNFRPPTNSLPKHP